MLEDTIDGSIERKDQVGTAVGNTQEHQDGGGVAAQNQGKGLVIVIWQH